MRTIILFICGILPATVICAQDIITTHDGDEIQAKVLDITDTEVKYKKWSNPDGPSYTAKKSDIFMIKYQNGEKDVFQTSKHTEAQQDHQPQIITCQPSENNTAIIAQYNSLNTHFKNIKKKNKAAPYWLGLLGYASHSVIESDYLRFSLEPEMESIPAAERNNAGAYKGRQPMGFYFRYCVCVTNLTNQTLYIDKAKSFRVDGNGESQSYYNQDVITYSDTKSTSNVLGVGGVVGAMAGGGMVGRSKSNSTAITFSSEQYICIPPHGKVALSKDTRRQIQNAKYNGVYYSSPHYINTSSSECVASIHYPGINIGEEIDYTENDAPNMLHYNITFYAGSNPEQAYMQNISVFPLRVIGSDQDFHHMYATFSTFGSIDYDKFINKYTSEIRQKEVIVRGIAR